LTDRDPPYITPAIKALLRLKNKLIRAGKTERAGGLALQIGAQIVRCNTGQFARGGEGVDAKEMWRKVRLLSRWGGGGKHATPGITADGLNLHNAATSTDTEYERPAFKATALRNCNPPFTELRVFTVLDRLHATVSLL